MSKFFLVSLRIFSDLKQIEKNHQINWYKIFNDNRNMEIRRAISLSLEVLNHNFSLTNNFNNIKQEYLEYFPSQNSVLDKYKKVLKLKENEIYDKFLYRIDILFSSIKTKKFSDFLRFIIDWILFKLDSNFKLK